MAHGQQRLVCWFTDYCKRTKGPRLWKNTLFLVCALAQESIWSNCLSRCRINHWKLWKYWCCCVKLANRIAKITITCYSERNMETRGFQRHQATYWSYESTTATESQMTIKYLKDVSTMLALMWLKLDCNS